MVWTGTGGVNSETADWMIIELKSLNDIIKWFHIAIFQYFLCFVFLYCLIFTASMKEH